jgi:hypothetical protein
MARSRSISIRTILRQYLALIGDPRVSEERVHQFLVEHPALIPALWPHENTVFSKLALGSQHEVDFAHTRENTPGATWHLIEIEKPQDLLFTKSGNPSAKLIHAMRQLQDWQTWFLENRSYILNNFPYQKFMQDWGLWKPELLLVIGRRKTLNDSNRKLTQRLSEQGIQIMTFDRLADRLFMPMRDRSQPLRSCKYLNGRIQVVSEMTMHISYTVCIKRGI